MILLVVVYGGMKFRKVVVNKFGTDDWKLPILWVGIVQFIAPLEAVGLLVWWAYDLIKTDPSNWAALGTETFMVTILEWLGLMVFVLLANLIIFYKRPSWMEDEIVRPRGQSTVTFSNDAFCSEPDMTRL